MNKKILLFGIVFLFLISFVYSIDSYPYSSNPLTAVYYNSFEQGSGSPALEYINNNDLVLSGTYTYTSGVAGLYSISSNLNNDFKGITSYGDTTLDSGAISISMWIDPTTGTTEEGLISKWDNSANNQFSILIGSLSDYKLYSYISTDGSSNSQDGWDYVFDTSSNVNWYHIVIILDPVKSNCSLYVNSTFYSNWGCGTTSPLYNSTYNIELGRSSLTGLKLWDGGIDEVLFFNRAIRQDEIDSLYLGVYGPHPSENFEIFLRDSYFNQTINTFNATIDGITYFTTNGTITTPYIKNDSTSLYNIILESANYDIKIYTNFNITNDLNGYLDYSYNILNITAKDFIDNSTINGFTITLNSVDYSTTNGSLILDIPKNESLTIYIDSLGYALNNKTIYSDIFLKNLEFFLYPENSISIFIYDESTNFLISENITIKFSSIFGEFTNISKNGNLFIEGLETAEYDLTFSSENYQTRIYTITVDNRSHQNLKVFLTKSTDTTIFTIKDKDTANLLENVQVTMYKTISGIWQPVEVRNSDITGRVQLSYEKGTYYQFYISLNNYEPLIFYLNPILFSTYNIGLQSLVSDNSSPDYNDVTLIFTEDFITGENTFNFLIQSANGVLIDYGYNLTYPESFNLNSGNNAIGEQLTTNFNITNAISFDRVELNYYYETTTSSGRRYFKNYFPITITEYNNTMMTNKSKTYGLGLFERILVITLIGIFILGFASLIGKPIPGLILVLFVWSWFVYVGFIEWWLIAITFLVGIIFISRSP